MQASPNAADPTTTRPIFCAALSVELALVQTSSMSLLSGELGGTYRPLSSSVPSGHTTGFSDWMAEGKKRLATRTNTAPRMHSRPTQSSTTAPARSIGQLYGRSGVEVEDYCHFP